jgi:hypothetical protein
MGKDRGYQYAGFEVQSVEVSKRSLSSVQGLDGVLRILESGRDRKFGPKSQASASKIVR